MRQTLAKPVSQTGHGIHTGQTVRVTLKPAPINTGICFINSQDPTGYLRASPDAIASSTRATVLSNDHMQVRTPEHLLAALAAYAITDVMIDLDGPEIPILDGSARGWVQCLDRAGLAILDAQANQPLQLRDPIRLTQDNAQLLAVPDSAFKLTYVLNHDKTPIGIQVAHGILTRDWFVNQVAPARTFGFASDLTALHAQGLAHGVTSSNCLGVTDTGYTSDLRVKNEPAYHKLLDIIGDLSLVGRPIQAHIISVHAGHSLNLKLAHLLGKLT